VKEITEREFLKLSNQEKARTIKLLILRQIKLRRDNK